MSHFGIVRLMEFFLSLAVTITDEPAQILINRASGCVSVARMRAARPNKKSPAKYQ